MLDINGELHCQMDSSETAKLAKKISILDVINLTASSWCQISSIIIKTCWHHFRLIHTAMSVEGEPAEKEEHGEE